MSVSANCFDVDKLHCYGCSHSAGESDYPGRPSGERPCCFCIRNKARKDPPEADKWYDGSEPVYIPMDCYQNLDMNEQTSRWLGEEDDEGEFIDEGRESSFIRYRNRILS